MKKNSNTHTTKLEPLMSPDGAHFSAGVAAWHLWEERFAEALVEQRRLRGPEGVLHLHLILHETLSAAAMHALNAISSNEEDGVEE